MPVKTCVANDGVREPASRSWSSTSSRSSAIVTPGTTCGVTAAIACSTVRHARPIASSSSSVFTRRSSLTSDDPVRSRSKPKTRPSLSVVSAQTRSPIATAPARPEALGDPLEDAKPSSVSVTTTSSPSGRTGRSNVTTMRGRTKTGSASGRKKPPGDPAVRVRALSEERDPALDPVRYSRSAERPRKRSSTSAARMRSERRRRRSA